MALAGNTGFASAVLVTLDDKPLGTSSHLLLCRASTDAAGAPSTGLPITLKGLGAGSWRMIVTRIAGQAAAVAGDPGTSLAAGADGGLALPATKWSECELTRM